MNKYLETIDTAISAVHSKRYSDDYYTMSEYAQDLQNLLELRSFVEQTIEGLE
jgi:hypothetical protein